LGVGLLDQNMSFEIFVQTFQKGEFDGFPRQGIRDAFGTYLSELESDFWRLRYDDANSCDLYLNAHHSNANLVHGFMLSKPCGDLRLWDALAFILSLGNIVLYFPGGQAPLVADISIAPHLPQDMIEALGQPIVVTSGNEILHEIQAT
jgi:hypothetical protein